MEKNTEYHDPDYPELTASTSDERPRLTKEQKVDKIRDIVEREFTNEIGYKEDELNLIDERVTGARRMLHQLRCLLVRQYYDKPLSAVQIQDDIASQYEPRAKAEVSSILSNSQKRIHPSLKKLLGKGTVDLEEIFRFRSPRNKTKRDYVAMLQAKNVTVKEDTQLKTLRPETNSEPSPEPTEPIPKMHKKVPRTMLPKNNKVISINEATRNKQKHKYRVIIGNTSKYAPSCSAVDRSTHKWLLYVRGPQSAPDLSMLVTRVTITLHHTYAPHHTVSIDKPPFHVSRRGWGEFPAKIELHFSLPDINPPVTLEHTITLDRNYTGLQTMGCETLADVWLYSNEQMLPFEYKDEDNEIQQRVIKEENKEVSQPLLKEIKKEIPESEQETENSWMEFFTKNPAELNVDDMIIKPERHEEDQDAIEQVTENKTKPESPQKRLMKYINPTTGKIFYLEMDFNLDISKVQEIIINSKGNKRTAKVSPSKNGTIKEKTKSPPKNNSLLKPEVKNEIINKIKTENDFSHIENDHCYILPPKLAQKSKVAIPNDKLDDFKSSHYYDKLCTDVSSMTCVRTAVNYLLRKIPVICDKYCQIFPFVVDNEKKYWMLDFVKRRNVEWSRAKYINKMLTENFIHGPIWRTKQILLFSRLHGYNPVKPDSYFDQDLELNTTAEAFSSNMKDSYPKATDISTLSVFQDGDYLQNGVEDEIDLTVDVNVDVVNFECSIPSRVISPRKWRPLQALPHPDEETRLRYLYIERSCGALGILLTNEDVGQGHCYSAVHAVLLSAMKQFAEELVRGALARKLADMKQRARTALALPTLPVWDSPQSSPLPLIELEHVVRSAPLGRARVLTARQCAARADTYTAL